MPLCSANLFICSSAFSRLTLAFSICLVRNPLAISADCSRCAIFHCTNSSTKALATSRESCRSRDMKEMPMSMALRLGWAVKLRFIHRSSLFCLMVSSAMALIFFLLSSPRTSKFLRDVLIPETTPSSPPPRTVFRTTGFSSRLSLSITRLASASLLSSCIWVS